MKRKLVTLLLSCCTLFSAAGMIACDKEESSSSSSSSQTSSLTSSSSETSSVDSSSEDSSSSSSVAPVTLTEETLVNDTAAAFTSLSSYTGSYTLNGVFYTALNYDVYEQTSGQVTNFIVQEYEETEDYTYTYDGASQKVGEKGTVVYGDGDGYAYVTSYVPDGAGGYTQYNKVDDEKTKAAMTAAEIAESVVTLPDGLAMMFSVDIEEAKSVSSKEEVVALFKAGAAALTEELNAENDDIETLVTFTGFTAQRVGSVNEYAFTYQMTMDYTFFGHVITNAAVIDMEIALCVQNEKLTGIRAEATYDSNVNETFVLDETTTVWIYGRAAGTTTMSLDVSYTYASSVIPTDFSDYVEESGSSMGWESYFDVENATVSCQQTNVYVGESFSATNSSSSTIQIDGERWYQEQKTQNIVTTNYYDGTTHYENGEATEGEGWNNVNSVSVWTLFEDELTETETGVFTAEQIVGSWATYQNARIEIRDGKLYAAAWSEKYENEDGSYSVSSYAYTFSNYGETEIAYDPAQDAAWRATWAAYFDLENSNVTQVYTRDVAQYELGAETSSYEYQTVYTTKSDGTKWCEHIDDNKNCYDGTSYWRWDMGTETFESVEVEYNNCLQFLDFWAQYVYAFTETASGVFELEELNYYDMDTYTNIRIEIREGKLYSVSYTHEHVDAQREVAECTFTFSSWGETTVDCNPSAQA